MKEKYAIHRLFNSSEKDWTEIVHIHFPTALGYSLHIYHNVHSTLINISDVYSNIYI